MELGIYNAAMLRLAAEARGAGRLAERHGSAEILNPTCGDRIALDVRLAEDRIAALGYDPGEPYLMQALIGLSEEPGFWRKSSQYKKLQPYRALPCDRNGQTFSLAPGRFMSRGKPAGVPHVVMGSGKRPCAMSSRFSA